MRQATPRRANNDQPAPRELGIEGQSSDEGSGDRQAREMAIINQIAEALNRSPEVEGALMQTLSLVADLLGLRTGWIWLLDPDTEQFYNAAVQNLPPYLQEPVRMTGRSCWCIDSYRAGKLTPKNIDVLECSRLHTPLAARENEATSGLKYHASIPLYFQDKPLGIMNVAAPSWRKLLPDELRLLSTIAYQVGIAIERARLAEEGARLARLEERTRIAREIHDTLAQGLTAIILHLEGAIPHLGRSPEKAGRRLESALKMAKESLEEARRSVMNLRAVPLDGKPLAEALLSLGRSFTAETGVRVQVHAAADHPLPSSMEMELYRIAQETLTNIRRHSGASEVIIRLRTVGDRTRLSLQDNGHGFDPGQIPENSHGIMGMRERAMLIGGSLRIVSVPGRGTAVAVIVPRSAEDLR